MRTTKTTEVIEEFDEQGRVVRRTTTTTEEKEEGTPPITYPWTYTTPYYADATSTTTTATINTCHHTDAADSISGTCSGCESVMG